MTLRFFSAIVSFSLLFAASAFAHLGDCGQPTSNGPAPTVADALTILRAGVGHSTACDTNPCVCDTNGNGLVNSADCLVALRRAVSQPVVMECPCGDPFDPGCTSATFSVVESDFDLGWTGVFHDAELVRGTKFSVRIAKRCSVTSSIECLRDEDCPDAETCRPTCNCNDDVSCELIGPTHETRCRNDLGSCETNVDCDSPHECVHLFGPPQPFSSAGAPFCMVTFFKMPLVGTFDAASGETQLSATLAMRMTLGDSLTQPCPRCGTPEQNPEIGDQFVCSGGQKPGEACTVHGVSGKFGGTSFDCPPIAMSATWPADLAIRLSHMTTGTTAQTAQLPCDHFLFKRNPTLPGSNPKCIDRTAEGDSICTSNADCMRCTKGPGTVCASNADCTGNGYCAEAPDQPVTCGFWCHCGFCNANPDLPCFQADDCPAGQACLPDADAWYSGNLQQQRPNDCGSDSSICGGEFDERCATTQIGSCSEASYRSCQTDDDCEEFDAGSCTFEPRQCFESQITRSGVPSPLGAYCARENKTCTTNADCTSGDDFCAPDSARPQTAALVCMRATTRAAVDGTTGLTGPAALRLSNFVQICRCGDGEVGCEEECDDGNNMDGDGCNVLCVDETVP